MKYIAKKIREFAVDKSGAALAEYAVALLVVTIVGVLTMTALGNGVQDNIVDATAVINAGD